MYAAWIYVRDLEESLQFYRDILRLKFKNQNQRWIEFDVNGVVFAIQEKPSYKGPVKPRKARIIFEVENLQQTLLRLRKKGVKLIGPIQEQPLGKLQKFEDPNGHRLDLIQRT